MFPQNEDLETSGPMNLDIFFPKILHFPLEKEVRPTDIFPTDIAPPGRLHKIREERKYIE